MIRVVLPAGESPPSRRFIMARAIRFLALLRESPWAAVRDEIGVLPELPPVSGPRLDVAWGLLQRLDAKSDEIGLTSEEIGVVIRALDLWSRLGMGQMESIAWEMQFMTLVDGGLSREIRREMNRIKREKWGFAPGQSHSIRSEEVPEIYRCAYDMLQVIRKLEHDRVGGPRFSIWSDPFWATSTYPKLEASLIGQGD